MSEKNLIIPIETDVIDYDDLEQSLEADLKESLEQVDLLEKEKQKIGNPEYLGNTIMQVVWDQFIMQVGSVAGDDFIKENKGLTLDLRKDTHIQSAENFSKGRFASRDPNKELFQKRYDKWQDSFEPGANGEPVIKKSIRKEYDDAKPTGSKTIHKDHIIPVAEDVRDPRSNMLLSKSERIAFASSDKNIQDLDAGANHSKKDKPIKEWIDKENKQGLTPDERFPGVTREDQLKKDDNARNAKEELLKKKQEKYEKLGKQSRKAEAFKIGGKALRAAVMAAFMNWIRILIGKLIAWLRNKKKSLQTLIEAVKASVKEFIKNLKQTILSMTEAVASTLLTAIGNPLVDFIQKIWVMLKQGGRSVKEAVEYLHNPENKCKSFSIILLEIGKIVVAGFAAVGAMALSEIIEKGLSTIPVLAFPIPLLGSLASIIGMFLGAVIAGIAGALVLRWIDSMIAYRARNQLTEQQISQRNTIISSSGQLVVLNEKRLSHQKAVSAQSIMERHSESSEQIGEIIDEIEDSGNSQRLNGINQVLTEI